MTGSRRQLSRNRLAAIGLVVALATGLVGFVQSSEAATTTLTKSVVASADDARSPDSGAFSTTERVALVGSGNGSRTNVNGFRFNGLTIPPGSIVTGVSLSLVKDKAAWNRVVVDCAFEAGDNAAPFSSAASPARRATTAARAHTDSNVKRLAGRRYTVCDGAQLVASLQQVIDRSGWKAGNAVALLVSGPAAPAWARTSFLTGDAGAQTAPQLTVSYTSPAVVPTATPTNTPSPPTATSTPVSPTATSSATASPSAYAANVPWSSRPSWTQPAGAPSPVAGQPCPVWVHDRYAAQGPDGLWYPTWHPSVDPQYGCPFGHEHGDDPTGSPALQGRPVLFGYATLKAGMNEAHIGFKVHRWDNIHHPNAPAHEGASVVMTIHQGTSGAARFTVFYHSVQFDYVNPTDGRFVHVTQVAPFGTLLAGCGANDPNMQLNLQQANIPGARQVSADPCFTSPKSPYEDWITALYVGVDSQGNWKAYLDPHFAVFNPNTYCVAQNGACTLGYSDVRVGTGADPASTSSWFKGDKREAYLNQVWLDNAGGSPSVWTDPYGNLVAPNTPGAIEQIIAAIDSRPLTNSAAFGADHEHDPDGSVHAPN